MTVGAGGIGGGANSIGADGANSTFASVTASKGHGGNTYNGGASGSGKTGGSGDGSYGGGGAGNASNGTPNSGATGGAGGNSTPSSISGISVNYGYGGGGCGSLGGVGSADGGGSGGSGSSGATAGTANTGNGGGGSYVQSGGNKNGGSGIVIIQYLTPVPPVASFTVNQTAGTAPLTVQFNDTSANFPTSWNWSYQGIVAGNNTQTWFSTLQNTTASFTTGNYTIALNASNSYGYSISTQTTWINVTAPPVASFTTNVTSGVKPLAVAFTDTSTNASSYYWMFGDGNTSTVQSPTFTYKIAGTYTVNHSASNGYTTNWSNQTNLITVLSVTDPNPTSMIKYNAAVSNQNINNQTPYIGTATIRNISSNTTRIITNFAWNPTYVSVSNIRVNQSSTNITGLGIDSSTIGNGYAIVNESNASGFVAPANATFDFNITYVKYVAPGTSVPFSFDSSSKYYDVGNSTYWNFDSIVGANAIIGVWGPIGANFSANATTVAVGSPVAFSDTSTGYPDAWSWTFGDGGTSTQQNPVYSYTSAGNYTVSETAYMSENATVTNTLTKTGYINVTSAPPPAPIAAFTGTPLIVSAGLAVQFTDQSLNSPTSWIWAFGDGNGNTQQNPSHVYSVVGNYTVNLTATNAQGSNTLSKTNYIQVVPLAMPVASFTTNVTSGGIPFAVQFTDTSSNMPTSWAWTFGDGGISALQNPSHTFASVGNFTVTETAYNAAGNSSAVKYIVATTLSGFTRQDLVMAPQYTLTINFVDSSTNLPIPVVTVLDSNGNNATTSAGTYTGTYPYGVVVIYATSSGYASTSASYVVTGNLVETVPMTKNAAASTPNTNVIWTPQSVAIQVLDANNNPVIGSAVNITAVGSTLPGGLSGAVSYFQQTYGCTAATAQSMLAANTTYQGSTDSSGYIIYQMASVIQYSVVVKDPLGYNFTQTLYPASPWWYQIQTPNTTTPSMYQQAKTENLNLLNSVYVANTTENAAETIAKLNIYFYDAAGQSNGLDCWFMAPNKTVYWQNSSFGYGAGLQLCNLTVKATPYDEWQWGAASV
jgi:PKD repeat protein